jgi:hypothetical protein
MNRKTFLTASALVALAVGGLALFLPAVLLRSKGVAPEPGTLVWVRELGVALLSIGTMALLLRGHGDSPTLRAFLIGNAVLQLGLFPVELVAYGDGVITELAGVVPNSILHLVLGSAFAVLAARIRTAA